MGSRSVGPNSHTSIVLRLQRVLGWTVMGFDLFDGSPVAMIVSNGISSVEL